jgi:outer membrane receptor protein involved in Fe transport
VEMRGSHLSVGEYKLKSLRFFSTAFAVIVALSLVMPMSAQQAASSSVTGWVSDPSGAAIANAAVTLTDAAKGVSRTTSTDAHGNFAIVDLAQGKYELGVVAKGFSTSRQDVALNVGRTLNLAVKLKLGADSTSVDVAALAAGVDTTSSTVDTVIGASSIQNLPLNGRNYLELALLAPGNAPAPNFDPTKSHTVLISSTGQLGRGSNVIVDGADNNDDVVGGSLVNIPQDAVEEFQLATSRFSATLGRSSSSVINIVTRSGDNAMHGSVAFFERDKNLQAEPLAFNSTAGSATPPFHRQQYAASIGGPIVKSKAWWFVSVEDRQQLGGQQVATRDLATRSFTSSFANEPLHDWLATERLDWQASSKDRVSFRDSMELEDDLSQSTLDRAVASASQQQQSSNHLHSLSASWAHTFSPNLLNQLRFSDNNFSNQISPTVAAPQISFPSFQEGASFRVPQGTKQFRLQFGDTLTWTRGAHIFNFGADVQRVDADFDLGVFQQGMIVAVEDFPDFDRNGDGFVNDDDVLFAVGLRSANNTQSVIIPDARNWYTAVFAQDDWRVRRNLTLNLGLRYETDSDANNRSRYDQINPIVAPFLQGTRRKLNNNWGPRVGFAWSPTERTVVRGGYGIYYDRVTLEIESLERGLDGKTLPINAHLGNLAFMMPDGTFAPGAPTLSNAFGGPVIPGAGASGIDIIDNNLRNPMVQQFSLGIEQDLGHGAILRVDGVHDLGTHFIIGRPIGTVFNPVAGGLDTVTNIESSVNTKYDAMLVSFHKKFSTWGEMNAAYTLAKAFNYANDDQIPFTHAPLDPNNLRLEYGPTPNDQRHRFVFSGTARLPWSFQFSPIWTLASGVPMDILLPDGSNRIPLLGRNAGGRQFHNGSELNAFLQQVNNSGGINGEFLPYVDNNARFGDSFQSFDMRLSRTFRFTENVQLQGMVEIFNLFNQTNILGRSNSNYSGFQNVLARDANAPANPSDPSNPADPYMHSSAFGKAVSGAGGIFGSGGPRAFQFGVRLSF